MVRLLPPAEVAELLAVSVSALAQMRSQGDGPAFVKVGTRVRYRRTDLDAYLTENTHTPRRNAVSEEETNP